jgi:hypothetical protein
MTRIRMGLLLGLLLALALAVAACDGGGDDKPSGVASLGGSATPTTSGSKAGGGKDPSNDLRQLLAWARCMRQHGLPNLPDPQLSGDGGGITQQVPRGDGKGPNDPKFKAAEQTCKQYQPDGGQPGRPSPQEQQEALAFARCMRQHGINTPDPKITAEGIVEQPPTGMRKDDPRLRAAWRTCEQRGGDGG